MRWDVAQGEALGRHTRPETGVLDWLEAFAIHVRTPGTANPKQQVVPSVAVEYTMRWNMDFAVDHCRSCWKFAQRLAPMWDVMQSETLRPGVLDQWVAVVPNVRLVIPNRIDVDHTVPSVVAMLSLL